MSEQTCLAFYNQDTAHEYCRLSFQTYESDPELLRAML